MQLIAYVLTWMLVRIRSERGQDLIEYAMLGGLLAFALLAIGVIFNGAVGSMAGNIRDCIDFEPTPCNIAMP